MQRVRFALSSLPHPSRVRITARRRLPTPRPPLLCGFHASAPARPSLPPTVRHAFPSPFLSPTAASPPRPRTPRAARGKADADRGAEAEGAEKSPESVAAELKEVLRAQKEAESG
jgi:hypothetical protein